MKKCLIIALLCICILALFLPLAYASEEPTYAIQSDATVTSGDTISVQVGIRSNPGVISLRFRVVYSDELELIDVIDRGLLKEMSEPSPQVASPYTLKWSDYTAVTDNTANGDVVTLVFRAAEDLIDAEASIRIEHVEGRNASGEKVTFAGCSKKITVTCDHAADQVAFRWDESKRVGQAYWVCTGCEQPFDLETVTASEHFPGTCQKKSRSVYTATAIFNDRQYTDTYTVFGDYGDHSFTNYISDGNATTESDGTKTAVCDHGCGHRDTMVDEGSKLTASSITSSVYTVAGSYIRKISAGTKVSELINGINEKQYIKVFNGTQEVSGNTLVGTGMVVKLMDGSTVKAFATVVVTGDTNGDGKITITDMLAVKSHVLKKSTLSGAVARAADTNADGGISITDFIQIKASILGRGAITPN